MVVVPRDGADPERIMNHSSILRKYKVSGGVLQCLGEDLSAQGDTLPWVTKHLRLRVLSSDGWDEQWGHHTAGLGGCEGQTSALKPSLLSCFSSFPPCRTTSWW